MSHILNNMKLSITVNIRINLKPLLSLGTLPDTLNILCNFVNITNCFTCNFQFTNGNSY